MPDLWLIPSSCRASLPSDRYQFTPWWQRHMCQHLPKVVTWKSKWPRVEPATLESRRQCPNHYIAMQQNNWDCTHVIATVVLYVVHMLQTTKLNSEFLCYPVQYKIKINWQMWTSQQNITDKHVQSLTRCFLHWNATDAGVIHTVYKVTQADYTLMTNSGLTYENPPKTFWSRFIRNNLSVGDCWTASLVNWWSKLLTSLGLFWKTRANLFHVCIRHFHSTSTKRRWRDR